MSTQEQARPRKLAAAVRKSQILHAALGIGSKKGLSAMTMDDVAHAAKLSKGLPFYYFKSKQRLHLVMIDLFSRSVGERSADVLGSDESPETKLRGLAWAFVGALTIDCKHPQLLIEFWALSLRDREVAQRIQGTRDAMCAKISDLLRGIRGGARDAARDLSARTLYAAWLGIASQWLLSGKSFDPRAALDQSLDWFLCRAKGAHP